ncbi:MAG: 16S rRNA (guanine(966)-N(2))-methyltransferase RsmD [Pseudomonadota bacterium]
MRIIAGKYRGTRLAELGKGDARAHLRPTSDRVRESLFSILSHRDALIGARVLDLFAGTGALGFEALSRGADQALFVESGRVAQRLIEENIDKLRLAAQADLLRADATRLPALSQDPYDLIFLDPPYGKRLGEQALELCLTGRWLAAGALVVWEEAAPMLAPEGFVALDTRRFGSTHVTLLECCADGVS